MYMLKLIFTTFIGVFGVNWLFHKFYISSKRDFTSVAYNQQANISSVRKENETAHYRNFLVPLGFPLITGLSLSLKYKIRNGNFADVWKAIMELAGNNTITFKNGAESVNLKEVNGMASHLLQLCDQYRNVGIAVPQSSLQGFVMSIAAMIGSVKGSLKPHFLASIPRQKFEDMDVLLISSWSAYKMLNGSEKWYKLVIVCEPMKDDIDVPDHVQSWDSILQAYVINASFQYTPAEDNSDDTKIAVYATSSWNATTSFTQGCLVSGIASFIQGFPSGHQLTCVDSLAVAGRLGDVDLSIHFWHKALAVLLHGGCLSFVSEPGAELKNLRGSTLLFCEPKFLSHILDEIKTRNCSLWRKLRFAWATALLSEGVFTNSGQSPFAALDELRCVFVAEHIQNTQLVSSFPERIPTRQPSFAALSRELLTSEKLNSIRAQLGSRVVVELYCPYVVMGPLFQTSFYDYRVLPSSVDSDFLCCGAISTNLEGKLVKTDENPELDVTKRQGMLCVRGFTIGKPLDHDRLEAAMKLSAKFSGGEGWMPMVGIFGLWGKDGCLYIYK